MCQGNPFLITSLVVLLKLTVFLKKNFLYIIKQDLIWLKNPFCCFISTNRNKKQINIKQQHIIQSDIGKFTDLMGK